MGLNPKLNLDSFEAAFHAIDTHTVGEFTRVVTSGFPDIKADSIMEKKHILEKKYDQYRKALMNDSREDTGICSALFSQNQLTAKLILA